MGHRRAADDHPGRREGALAGPRQELGALRHEDRSRRAELRMTIPDLPGVLARDEVIASGEHLAGLQAASGMIPWWPGGHCDPWNHVESAIALDIAGLHDAAERAYEWLADIQRPDGSWHNYYLPDGDRDATVEEAKIDTNVV